MRIDERRCRSRALPQLLPQHPRPLCTTRVSVHEGRGPQLAVRDFVPAGDLGVRGLKTVALLLPRLTGRRAQAVPGLLDSSIRTRNAHRSISGSSPRPPSRQTNCTTIDVAVSSAETPRSIASAIDRVKQARTKQHNSFLQVLTVVSDGYFRHRHSPSFGSPLGPAARSVRPHLLPQIICGINLQLVAELAKGPRSRRGTGGVPVGI